MGNFGFRYDGTWYYDLDPAPIESESLDDDGGRSNPVIAHVRRHTS